MPHLPCLPRLQLPQKKPAVRDTSTVPLVEVEHVELKGKKVGFGVYLTVYEEDVQRKLRFAVSVDVIGPMGRATSAED
jgi:hypothetical protein